MTRREAERQTRQIDTLAALGFTRDEAESLRRISMTLHRWHERECGIDGGCIERDEDTGKTYWLSSFSGRRTPIADRETGARRRLETVLHARNVRAVETDPSATRGSLRVTAYVQTDPRGCALYLLRPGDVPEGKDADAYYTRGIAIS